MFYGCSSLIRLDIGNWNTSSLVVADNMFRNCSSLTNLDIGKWDTSSLGSVAFMFSGCSSLIRLDIGNWNMSSVEDMSHMFANCSILISLDIGNWDTSSVEDIGSIFQRCSSLVSLNLGNWATNSVEGMRSVFSGCSNLVSVNISGWDTSSVTDMAYIFKGCIKLQKIILGKNFKFVGKNGYLPTPSTTYFPYTTGKWRNTSGQAFTPEEIPNNVADTYIVDTINYKITFNANGGSGTMADQKVDYNESKQLSGNVFVRNGYTFTGWNTQSNGSGTTYKDKATVKNLSETNGDIITLYAKWQKNTYTISYTLNGGSISGQKTSYDVTTEAFTLPTPTKTGYTFTGWTGTGLSGATKSVTVTKRSTGNRSYTANWSANEYIVSYNENGGSGSMSQDTATYGESYTAKANNFFRPGYTFAGWNESADGKGSDWTSWIGKPWTWTYTRSITLYAQWIKNTYSISYNLNGGTISGQKTSYDVTTEAFTLPTPIRNGYTFTGWVGTGLSSKTKSVTVEKGSTGNRSYTANWSANVLTINYHNDDGTGFRYVNSTEYSDVTGKDILFTGRGRYDDDFDAKYGLLNASRIYKKGYHSDKYWYLDKKNGNIKADEDLGLAKVQDAAEIFGKLSDFEKGNVTIDIYASMVPNEYTVKFDGNSETSGNVQNLICTYDKLFNIPENTFKKDNYEFVEWNTEKNGSGQSYKSKESVKNLTDKNGAVITLYAQWKIKTYSLSISHTVSGNMGNRNQDFDFSMTLSDKESGTINAVFIDKSGNQTSKTLSVNNENITFTLSHNESMKFIDIPYGTTYTITEKPVDGYAISHTNEKGTITDNKVATFTSTKSSIVPTSADTNVKEMSLIVGIGLIALIIILKKHKTKER